MRRLLEGAFTQAQVWSAYTRLGANAPTERERAMETLLAAGKASLPCLRLALMQTNQPRVQFGASVVLHRLGQPQGMQTLTEALLWRLQTTPEIALELEAAFLAIGPPDATAALIEVWDKITDGNDAHPTLISICRIWATLRDPRALDPLILRANRIPELFLKTVPWFGEMAILPLSRMLRDADYQRRILAIQALSQLNSLRAYDLLVPLLRDANENVRAVVPAALEATGVGANVGPALCEAIRDGYSTAEAVETVTRLNPPSLYETLLILIERWNPRSPACVGDTAGAVLAALFTVARAPLPNVQIVPALCQLLRRQPGAAILAATARLLGTRRQPGSPSDSQACDALWPLLAHAQAEVRSEAADALNLLGEPLGKTVITIVEECRPRGSLLNRLQSLLRGGIDPGQAATQAVQQVSQWLSRVSKETVEKLNPAGLSAYLAGDSLYDPRVPELLRQLLANALVALQHSVAVEETEALLTLNVAAARALARLGTAETLRARDELLAALRVTKRTVVPNSFSTPVFQKAETREVADVVRTAAADVIIQLYGAASFALFLEALYAAPMEARGTTIAALGRLGDVRALPHLQPVAADPEHPFCMAAQVAIADIRRINPEIMTLLRASSAADSRTDTLLRPAYGAAQSVPADQLLRPTAQSGLPPPDTLPPNAVTE